MEDLSMPACTSEPSSDCGLTIAEDPFGSGSIQSFGQRRQHHCDLLRGCFQTVQGGMAPSTERGAARLAAKGLDELGTAMLAVPNQRVDLIIGNADIGALLVGTGEACGVYSLRCSPSAFHLTPWTYWCRGRVHT